jgi:hypothetical protein
MRAATRCSNWNKRIWARKGAACGGASLPCAVRPHPQRTGVPPCEARHGASACVARVCGNAAASPPDQGVRPQRHPLEGTVSAMGWMPLWIVGEAGTLWQRCVPALRPPVCCNYHCLGDEQWWGRERAQRATRGADIGGACGDTWRASGPDTPPPAAARPTRRARAAVTRAVSTADPEALHRSGTLSRSGTTR